MKPDSYGSAFRESMKRSMERPAMGPTFTYMSHTTKPLGTKQDRRSPTLLRRVRRIWWHASEDIALIAWSVVVFIGFVELILIYGIR